MKIIKLLLNAILIVSFLCGCSKNIDKKEDAPTKTEENKKEDNKVNRQENNPNDKNNINNNEVINKTQDGEKSPNNETSQVKETPKETNRKVRLNVTPQVQKVWYYCAPTSVSMILSYRGVYVDQFTLAKEMGTYEPFGTHNKDAIRVINKNLRAAYQKFGVVKYNAFKGMGGNLSFAFAMLDYTNTGYILNSVHSREGCFVYVKVVDRGQTEVLLGTEEKEALEQALGYVERPV